jgi:hypothetical protein
MQREHERAMQGRQTGSHGLGVHEGPVGVYIDLSHRIPWPPEPRARQHVREPYPLVARV